MGQLKIWKPLRACIERLNIGSLCSKPRSHEPDTARRMSGTDLSRGEAFFLHQKQEKDVRVFSERSLYLRIGWMCLPEAILRSCGSFVRMACFRLSIH